MRLRTENAAILAGGGIVMVCEDENRRAGDRDPMLSAKFLLDARARFAIIGPPVSEMEITAVLASPFPGREDLIQFYLCQNGGGVTEECCVVHCGNPAHRVSRSQWNRLIIEGFYSISIDPEEKMHPFSNMLRLHNTLIRSYAQIPATREFLENHRPIAFDHSGMNVWIDMQCGYMRFMDWTAYREGPVEIASSFREFVTRFWINAAVPDLD